MPIGPIPPKEPLGEGKSLNKPVPPENVSFELPKIGGKPKLEGFKNIPERLAEIEVATGGVIPGKILTRAYDIQKNGPEALLGPDIDKKAPFFQAIIHLFGEGDDEKGSR